MLGPITPHWLTEYGCHQIIEIYRSHFPNADQLPTDKQAHNKQAFLEAEGREIWNWFCGDVKRGLSPARDYLPLSAGGEESRFSSALLTALQSLKPFDDRATDDAAAPKFQNRRFWMGLCLLGGGFLVLIATYFSIGWVASYFAKQRLDALSEPVVVKLKEVCDTLKPATTQDAVDDVKSATKVLEDLGPRVQDLRLRVSDRTKVLERLANLNRTLFQADAANKRPIDYLIDLHKMLTFPQAVGEQPSATDGALVQLPSPTVVEHFVELSKNATSLTIGPELQAKIKELRTQVAALPNSTSSGATNPQVVGRAKSELFALVKSLEEIAGTLPAKSFSLTDGDVMVLQALGNSLARVTSVIPADSAVMVDQIEDLVASFETDAKTLSNLVTQLTQQRDRLRINTDNLTTITVAATTLTDSSREVRNIVGSFEAIGTQAASPIILILFGIGAMMITFGVSSLLRWVKTFEQRAAEQAWADKMRFLTQFAAAHVVMGLDPARVMGRLRASVNVGEPEAPAAATPLAETLNELLKMVRIDRR